MTTENQDVFSQLMENKNLFQYVIYLLGMCTVFSTGTGTSCGTLTVSKNIQNTNNIVGFVIYMILIVILETVVFIHLRECFTLFTMYNGIEHMRKIVIIIILNTVISKVVGNVFLKVRNIYFLFTKNSQNICDRIINIYLY